MSLFQPLKTLVASIRTRVRNGVDCLLGETHEYYTSVYPGNQSYIIKKIINRLVKKVPLDNHNLEKIKAIDSDSIVIFTSKNKRFFDFLYFHTRLKALDLPFPKLGFDLRFFFLLPVKRVWRILLSHFDYFSTFRPEFFTLFVTSINTSSAARFK